MYRITQYDVMLLECYNSIGWRYSIAASFFAWLMLAVFLVSPASYASIQQSNMLDKAGAVGQSTKHLVRSVPLICVALIACAVSTGGLLALSWRWRHNYIWLTSNIIRWDRLGIVHFR